MAERKAEKDVLVVRLVLDVLEPANNDVFTLIRAIHSADGVRRVKVDVVDYDPGLKRLRVVVDGEDLDLEELERVIRGAGASVASVDGVSTAAIW